MRVVWEVDAATTLSLEARPFRKPVVLLGDQRIPTPLQLTKRGVFTLVLPDGRRATLMVEPSFGGAADVRLRVEGRLLVPVNGKPMKCRACGTIRPAADRFCGGCGAAAPPAEQYYLAQKVANAGMLLWGLAAMYAVIGACDAVLARMGGTARLRGDISAAAGLWHSPAGNDMVLAGVMAGLALWARREPLSAILIAGCAFCTEIAVGLMHAPAHQLRAIFLQCMVLLVLYRGAKAELALRAQQT